jgi:hypothetical protein
MLNNYKINYILMNKLRYVDMVKDKYLEKKNFLLVKITTKNN